MSSNKQTTAPSIMCNSNYTVVTFQRHVVDYCCRFPIVAMTHTVEPLLRGHPDERPSPPERPVNLNINVLISSPDERPPLLKGDFSDA